MTITNNTLQQALDYLEENEYEKAVLILESKIEEEPKNYICYWYWGLTKILQNEVEVAEEVWLSIFLEAEENIIAYLEDSFARTLESFLLDHLSPNYLNTIAIIYKFIKSVNNDYSNPKIKNFLEHEYLNTKKTINETEDLSEKVFLFKKLLLISIENKPSDYLRLGEIYLELGWYGEAESIFLEGLDLNCNFAPFHYLLGLTYERLGLDDKSICFYEKAIEKDAKLMNAYNNLGNKLRQQSQFEKAEIIYESAINENPNFLGTYVNLGNLYLNQGQFDRAINLYNRAISIQKSKNLEPLPALYFNLAQAYNFKDNEELSLWNYAYAYYLEQNYDESTKYLEILINLSNSSKLAYYFLLATCYKNSNLSNSSLQVYRKLLANCPENPDIYQNIILLYQHIGKIDDAIELAQDACQRFPDNWYLKRLNQYLLPIVYQSEQDIHYFRSRFIQLFENFAEEAEKVADDRKYLVLQGLELVTNYGLHFQGENDKDFLVQYGVLLSELVKCCYPNLTLDFGNWNITKGKKIKVGYVSARIGLIGFLFVNWLKFHNRDLFEIFTYDLGIAQTTSISKLKLFSEFNSYSDHYYHNVGNILAIAQQIINDKIDVLVYLDLGTEPITSQLASLRLAPVQCVTWGHPLTSGIANIDYFISNKAMEPEKADDHYSEIIIYLSHLGVSLSKPKKVEIIKERYDWGFLNTECLYVSCQMLVKYLPQYDYLFPEIAQKVPTAKFIFFQGESSLENIALFKSRLASSFRGCSLMMEDYCVFLPRLTPDEYLAFLKVADVFLDTIGWTGGVTSLDAIACSLPIVTIPGKVMRCRQSYGMLKTIGVLETVANTEQEYIQIAIRLGNDEVWRQNIKQKIEDNRYKLYEDKNCVSELESFYQQVTNQFRL